MLFDHLDADDYRLPEESVDRTLSPCLVIDLDRVEHNLDCVLAATGGADRWRPHVKTTKIPAVYRRIARRGVRQFKCATVREARVLARTLDEEGVEGDVLLAYPQLGPALAALANLADEHPGQRFSVLCEDPARVADIPSSLGLFIDLNPGMDRTGIPLDPPEPARQCVRAAGSRLRGLHFYDGHLHQDDAGERRRRAHAAYDRLLEFRSMLEKDGITVPELVTSGTPSFPAALAYEPFRRLDGTAHRVSPGTVVFHDLRSEELVPELGLHPAATVMARVVSHPRPGRITVDAGSKAVAAEAGDPAALALGWPGLIARTPSEEHLPFDVQEGPTPTRGAILHLVPRHVCPTVNLAEQAILVENRQVLDIVPVSARAHDVLL